MSHFHLDFLRFQPDKLHSTKITTVLILQLIKPHKGFVNDTVDIILYVFLFSTKKRDVFTFSRAFVFCIPVPCQYRIIFCYILIQ